MPVIIEPRFEASARREGRCPHCRTRLEMQEGGFLFVKNAIITGIQGPGSWNPRVCLSEAHAGTGPAGRGAQDE